MFSKNSKNQVRSNGGSPSRAAVPSIISPDLRMIGDINSDGEIQVDGTIDGDVRTHTLLVGETAYIKGEIVADNVRVHGNINGQIKAKSVSLASTAQVIGDILHENLSIEKGAYLEGHCRRLTESLDEELNKVNLLVTDGTAGSLPPPATKSEPKKAAG